MRQTYKLAVLISYMLMILLNILANALPINGQTTGVISDRYENLFAPAGVTFSIWGLIYLLLGIYVYMVLKDDKDNHFKRFNLFIGSSLLNGAWILSWHYDLIGLSLVIMLGLLLTLIFLVLTIDRHQTTLRIIFHVYLGWITVATIANVTIFLVSLNLSISTHDLWTVFVLWVGVIIGLLAGYRLKSNAYLLTLTWAYIGIYIKHQTVFANSYMNILTTVSASLVVFVAMILYLLYPYVKKVPLSH